MNIRTALKGDGLTHQEYLALPRFGSLDGLRAIGVLMVIWHHTAGGHVGAHGVTLFFAVSGFLITTLLLRERERNGVIDLKAFYIRRTLRIFPLYYSVLLLYVVVVTILERSTVYGQGFYANLPYFATYTSNIFVPLDGRVIFYFAWSLAAEEQFYLLWPALMVILGSRIWIPLTALIVLCVMFSWSKVPIAITAGSLMAVGLHSKGGFDAMRMGAGFTWIVAGALIISLGFGVPEFVVHLLCALLVAGCVVSNAFARVLDWSPIVYIGGISYGMYLLHMLCKNAVVRVAGDGPHVFLLTVVAVVAAASLSYRYYESFFLNLKARYGKPRTP